MKQPQQKELKLNMPQNFEPVFSNFAQVNHKNDEFNLMFAHTTPMGTGAIKASVTMTPQQMKILHKVVGENIKKYESTFGTIKTGEKPEKTQELHYIQ